MTAAVGWLQGLFDLLANSHTFWTVTIAVVLVGVASLLPLAGRGRPLPCGCSDADVHDARCGMSNPQTTEENRRA